MFFHRRTVRPHVHIETLLSACTSPYMQIDMNKHIHACILKASEILEIHSNTFTTFRNGCFISAYFPNYVRIMNLIGF